MPRYRPDPRKVGGTYRSGYWRMTYKVIAIIYTISGGRRHVEWRCQWDDGQTTTHCTAWDWQRDKIVEEPS